MKKTVLFFLAQFTILVILFSGVVFFTESKSTNMSITMTVEPIRTIIVDKNLRIVRILSNTREEVRPVVYLEGQDKLELPYTDSIMEQYTLLKKVTNFSKPGVVFERDDRVSVSFFKYILSLLGKMFRINF